MALLQSVLAFVVTLGVLVTVHEFGHFWVARRCGVKVLQFSVGFGKSLFSWTDRHGTKFTIAMLPFGGFVKMVDEREMTVPEELRAQAFNYKSVWQRIAIVAAGPIANFLLAIAAFWLMFLLGVQSPVPLIGSVEPGSPADKAGLQAGFEVVAIDDQATLSWYEINLALLRPLGESRDLKVAVRPFDPEHGAVYGAGTETYLLPLDRWLLGQERPQPIRSLGLTPWRPYQRAVIAEVVSDGAAAAAGLQAGDELVRANGQTVGDWAQWVALIQTHPGQALVLEVLRDGRTLEIEVTPKEVEVEGGKRIGLIGVGPAPVPLPAAMWRTLQYNPLTALPKALEQSWELTYLTLNSIHKMILGQVSVKNLSGPITIAKVAGTSARSGLENFLHFLAMLSISLGVLNLLPIPVLDGGHLLFYFIEAVRGRPLPEKVQELGFKIGLSLIFALMLMAVWNDLARL